MNILISVVLVTKFDLNIKGVAYGTFFSALITSIIFLIYTFWYLSKYAKIEIKFTQILNIKKIKDIFNINLNIFIRSVLLTFSFLFFTYLGNTISEDVVAANTILINLIFLSAFILDAYAFSTEGIVGYSIGSKNIILLKNVIKNSIGLLISDGYLNLGDCLISSPLLNTALSDIILQKLQYNTKDITLKELDQTIKRFKRRKKPGPDGVPMELYKELNKELKSVILSRI